jgi:hypothetical protein
MKTKHPVTLACPPIGELILSEFVCDSSDSRFPLEFILSEAEGRERPRRSKLRGMKPIQI